jgi:flagellin
MLSVNSNADAAQALRALTAVSVDREQIQSRINTGLRVANPKDDGAMWAIANGLRETSSTYRVQDQSLARAETVLDVTLAALEGVSDLLIEMREIAVALSDETLDTASFEALEEDYVALFQQTVTMVENASFNGVNLLDGSNLSMQPLGFPEISGANFSSLLQTGVTSTPAAVDVSGIFNGYSGTITGSFSGISNGNVNADVWGNVSGIINGSFSGDVYGDFSAIVSGSFTGTVYGNNSGIINGTNNGTFHNGSVAPPNPFTFADEHAALEDYITGAFTGVGQPGSSTATAYAGRVSSLNDLQEGLGQFMAGLGAQAKAVTIQRTFVNEKLDVTQSIRGSLIDADLAKESARLAATQTREQLAIQALSIANSAPSILTRLFA